MLKIEEYFLMPTVLRRTSAVPVASWGHLGTEAVPQARTLLNEVTDGDQPLRTFGLFEPPRGEQPGTYWAAHEVANGDDASTTVALEGGYFVGVEHVGPLARLVDSLRWFYEEYLPTSPYLSREGHHLFLFDPRFDGISDATILTFGVPVHRLRQE